MVLKMCGSRSIIRSSQFFDRTDAITAFRHILTGDSMNNNSYIGKVRFKSDQSGIKYSLSSKITISFETQKTLRVMNLDD